MQARQVRMDSKGRIMIPAEFRESMTEVVTLKPTEEGIIIAKARRSSFEERFRKIIGSKPKRTAIPENWPPSRMKRFWAEGR